MQQIVIAGCGYIGAKVARLWKQRGAQVTCLVRTAEKIPGLQSEGYTAGIFSLDDPAALALPETSNSIVYYLAPPPGGGIHDSRARCFISALATSGTPEKIIYMSATSVYSETRGGIVHEESPTEPPAATGKRRLDAEQAFLEYGRQTGTRVIILRVSGIYGPGRLPLMQLTHGHPLLREEESGPSNRIHADDLSAICLAAADRGENGDIFNISDGHPSSMTTYFNACADALGLPRPPQISMEEARTVMSPLMLSYVSESRIVDNRRMRERLGVTLRYPELAAGLAASVGHAAP